MNENNRPSATLNDGNLDLADSHRYRRQLQQLLDIASQSLSSYEFNHDAFKACNLYALVVIG